MPLSTIPHSRPSITDADIAAVAAQLRSGMIAEGEVTADLERRIAERFGFREAIAVGSGCQALRLALVASGIGAGALVGLPTYVCPEVMGVVEAIGAVPALADVGEDYLLAAEDAAVTGAKAVIVPALLGRRADVRRYRRSDVVVIADWAQYAPRHRGEAEDAYDLAILSFEATKLIAAGEGGAVLVNDPSLAERVRAEKRFANGAFKLNLYPLSDLQAALVRSQLTQLDAFLTRRAEIAARYAEAIGVWVGEEAISHFRFVARVKDAGPVLDAFAQRGIVARRPVDPMAHHVRRQHRDFPVADWLWKETVSLPCHPSLSEDEVSRVAQAAKELLA